MQGIPPGQTKAHSPDSDPKPPSHSTLFPMASSHRKRAAENSEQVPKPKSNSSRQRAAPPAPKKEIAFVNLTDSSGPIQDAEKRKLVRAHVMRGYQRERQAREDEEYENIRQKRLPDLKLPSTSIVPMPDSQPLEQDTARNAEPPFSDNLAEIDWTATLDYRPSQSRPEQGRIVSQQVEGDWIPIEQPVHQQTKPEMMDMLYTTSNTAHDLSQFEYENYDFDNLDPSDTLQLQEFVPEEIECPLISQSLTLSLSFGALNSGMMDPFNAMPGLKNARAQALMYHYNKVLVNTLIPVNPKDKWFNYAISDEALFHATMLHSAGHNAMLSGNNDLADPFQLKLEAIRLVNQRLNDPIRSTSDLTIAAVACLILFENQSGNVEVSNIHMNGLRRMINLRGGLQSLGLSGVLLRKVLWADVCNAMISHSKPRFNLSQAARTLAIQSAPASATQHIPIPPALSQILDPTESCTCDTQLAEIIIDLRQLCDSPPINALDGAITDHLYLVERRLVILLEPRNLGRHSVSCRSINRACFLAALTYIYISLRDFPVQAPLYTAFIERLSSALFIDNFREMWLENGYPMLLWVLSVGALGASGRSERMRFVDELDRIASALGITNFEDWLDALRRIVWGKRSEDGGASWKELWAEVEEVRYARLAGVNSAKSFDESLHIGGEKFYELF